MIFKNIFPASRRSQKKANSKRISNTGTAEGREKEKLNVWEEAASTFMALLMIMLGVIILGEVLLFRARGPLYPVSSLYVLIAAILFNASNFWREKLISRKFNTGISLSVNLAVIILLVNFTGGLSSEFYVAYFIIPAVAALCFGLKGTIISLSAVFLSLLWFFYQETGLVMAMRIESLLIRMVVLVLISVPFLVFVERDKKHEEALSVSFRELEKALNELKETHSQLVQSSKLAALGQLSASIAHDLSQPLASMNLYAQLALSKTDNGSPVKEDIEVIKEQTERIRKIAEGLRNFSRKSDFEPCPLIISKPLGNAVKLLSPRLRASNIAVIEDCCSDLPKINGDANQLQQVFFNILSNAKDALDSVIRKDKRIKIAAASVLGNQYVKVLVSDNGCGIPSDIQKRILEPFFTTKSAEDGVGLGLSITSSIVRRHSGFLRISSNGGPTNCGTTVKMVYPSVNAKPCWEVTGCKSYGGKDSKMCPVFQEEQGFRCWEIQGEGYFKETGKWLKECENCQMFESMMGMLMNEGMVESRPAMSD